MSTADGRNIQGVIQGQLDTVLNERGRYEAGLLAERLADVRITQIWTSDLQRAHEVGPSFG